MTPNNKAMDVSPRLQYIITQETMLSDAGSIIPSQHCVSPAQPELLCNRSADTKETTTPTLTIFFFVATVALLVARRRLLSLRTRSLQHKVLSGSYD